MCKYMSSDNVLLNLDRIVDLISRMPWTRGIEEGLALDVRLHVAMAIEWGSIRVPEMARWQRELFAQEIIARLEKDFGDVFTLIERQWDLETVKNDEFYKAVVSRMIGEIDEKIGKETMLPSGKTALEFLHDSAYNATIDSRLEDLNTFEGAWEMTLVNIISSATILWVNSEDFQKDMNEKRNRIRWEILKVREILKGGKK